MFYSKLVFFLLIEILARAKGSSLIKTDDCQVEFGCFFYPKGCVNNCEFFAKWKESESDIDFTLMTKLNGKTNMWLGMGLSDDTQMGNDSVTMCKYNSNDNQNSIESYYNLGKMNPVLINEKNASLGLKNIKIKVEGDFLKCSFKRDKKNAENSKKFFDLNHDYYLLMAKGNIEDGEISFHENNNLVSMHRIDFKKAIEVKSSSVSKTLVKIHAIFMIFAWIFLSTMGILLARYYKYIFPKAIFGGVQFWFTIHRAFMASVVLITLASFVVILYYKNWKWIDASIRASFAHSIFGIITIGLSFIQPIMAFFRPDKNAANRPIFNWAHRLVGLNSYLSSIVAIFLGIYIYSHKYFLIILIAWVAWLVIMIISLEIIDFKINSNSKIQNIQSEGLNIEKENTKLKQSSKTFFLILHFIISIVFTVVLILTVFEIF